jgi:hypothetical protein
MSRPNVLHCAIALAGLAVAAAAFGAEPPNTSAEPTITSTAATAESLICRDRLRPGSHIAMRTCLTAAQWAAAKAQASFRAPYAAASVNEGMGPWGNVSTTGASVGMNAFTQR